MIRMDEKIKVKAWHGGKLQPNPKLHYERGDSYMFEVEVDKTSYFELLDSLIETKSYSTRDFELYYLMPRKKFDEGLRQIKNDKDVMDMVVNLRDKDVWNILHLYAQGNTKAQIEAQPINTKAQPIKTPIKTKAHPENQPVKGFTKATANRILTPTKLLLGSTSCTLPKPVTNQEFQSEIQVDNGSASEGEANGSDDGSELEIEEELNLDDDAVWTDDDDDEWKESVAAIKESKLAEKELVERLLKNFHSEIQVEEAHSDCSSYEDSEGDANSPGESEDDDIKGKKHKVKVPVVTDYTDWSKWE
ncbi:uncharacterized protein LOC143576876 [Bidens hawaiensis]|uniref:uncharacterized protein LOC143576876 n=1 Tax=Bidens hawaiensis TaxID=980011 RepID=UPI00404B0C59